MKTIKTHPTTKGIKLLDKSALVGHRMKNTFIRSKDHMANQLDNGETSPDEYAGTTLQGGTDQLTHNITRTAKSSTKAAVQNGQVMLQQRRGKQANSTRQTAPDLPEQSSAELERPQQKGTPTAADRGRELAQKQASQRAKTRSQIKAPDAAGPIRQRESATGSIRHPTRSVKQAVRSTGRAEGRTVKSAERSAKTAVKTAQSTAALRHRTIQASAQAAQTTAKASATTIKKVKSAVVNTVKAIIAAAKTLVAAISAGGGITMIAVVVICLIGLIASSCFGIFFSGEDSGTGQTMASVIREINQEYEARLEEIQNTNPHDVLEMSGSQAVWTEVLSIYAVKTTTDPDNPQEVATMDDSKKALLKEVFWAMNIISYHTESQTDTVTVEVDDGEGNMVQEEQTETETTLYITVRHKTANEMADEYGFNADQRQQLTELLAEKNRDMWRIVLYGIGTGSDDIVQVALSQVGNVGGQPYWSWYGFSSRVAWCACFVSWCANECGYIDSGVVPKFSYCPTGVTWFKGRGQWQSRTYAPEPGTIIFFDWNHDGESDHVGIVEYCDGSYVHTVEGNTSGDVCKCNTYAVGYSGIMGYGVLSS